MTEAGQARRDRLGELFEKAAALPAVDRSAFLERECGVDAELRAELISLLASHETAPEFLDDLGGRVAGVIATVMEEALPDLPVIDGRYEVEARIGAGGMGVVYRARDTLLGRTVALKLLPAHLAGDAEARERLIREARAASALDHPGIATVYDAVLAGDGRLCIVMAWCDGETLQRRIARGPVPIEDVLACAQQLTDALTAAHEAGIIHRDIKPANVLLTRAGTAKMLDFGIARLRGEDITREGTLIGTVSYMSPEQTRGSDVDARADIWAMGALLHEMVTGRRAFSGDSPDATIYAIRHDEPPPADTLRPDTPWQLVQIICRCLAKQREDRYGSARELQQELSALTLGRALEEEQPSIIVLPFDNMSADPDNVYFSDGLTEEVIADLSNIRTLRVISRTSAMRFRNSAQDTRAIAGSVGVRYVLEGSVRKAADALRITARLVDAREDRQLWAERFDGTVHDVFAMQERVARAVADALSIRLSSGEVHALAERPIPDARAYESYLRARHEAWSFSREGLERALRHIETALEIVGDNELLYSTLGHIMALHLEAGIDPDGRARERVEQIAATVFSLNAESPRGHFLQALASYHRVDFRAAIDAGERAHALSPDDPDTLLLLGYIHAHIGRTERARNLWDRAMRVDPLTPLTHAVHGFLAIVEGRYADAGRHYQRCRDMDPESAFGAVCYGWALAYDNRADEAMAVLDDAAVRFRGSPFEGWAATLAHALRGDSEGTLRAITPAIEAAARDSEMFARALAQACAIAGLTDSAFYWLEREIELGMLNRAYLTKHDRFLDNVRNDPRFNELMERVDQRLAALGAF